jgi:TetR/AcrR family transcriptional regulator, regulator of autoinduction and epiphytic fitness
VEVTEDDVRHADEGHTEAPAVSPRVERTRAAVFEAGAELLLTGGPAAVTVDALVQQSGVARSTFYRHWPTREDFVVELFASLQPTIEPIDESLGFDGALRAAVRVAIDILTAQRWQLLLPAILLLRTHIPEVAEVERRHREEHEQQMAALLRLGERQGLVRPGLTARRATELLTGPILLAAMTGGIEPGLADDVVDRFLAAEREALRTAAQG